MPENVSYSCGYTANISGSISGGISSTLVKTDCQATQGMGEWLLSDGSWNDAGIWDDNATWND